MSSESNKELARRPHKEIFSRGNLAVADEIFAPNFTWHEAHLPPGLPGGPEGVKRFASMLRSAYPDMQVTTDIEVAEGDRVVEYWTFTGTHQGDFQGVQPTGRRVTVSGVDIWRIADGKIVDLHQVVDNLGILQQLGVVPEPQAAQA